MRRVFGLQFVGEGGAEFFDLGTDEPSTITLIRIVLKIILVIVFRRVEVRELRDFSNDRRTERARLVELFLVILGGLPLLVVVIEHGRAILRAGVVALAVERCRVVRFEMDFEQLGERDLRRVVSDLNHFRVAGVFVADLLVRRILDMPAAVTGDNFFHALELLEDRFGTPEAAAAERGELRTGRFGFCRFQEFLDLFFFGRRERRRNGGSFEASGERHHCTAAECA